MKQAIKLAELGYLPDILIRWGIRRLCQQRLQNEYKSTIESRWEQQKSLMQQLSQLPIAIETATANAQHYELPPKFFQYVLGPQSKYSCCYWPDENMDLATAEERSLEQIASRAELQDGQDVLELGCGWGSLTLWMAARYPNSQIVAITNSSLQQAHILQIAQERQLNNITVEKLDINSFNSNMSFDRIISVEMFEHIRNHHALLKSLHEVLRAQGKLFVHIFCHRELNYLFEVNDSSDWMSQYFFSGGMMPSFTYPFLWQERFTLQNYWLMSGQHYQKTAEAWLNKCDQNRDIILSILAAHYGQQVAPLWYQRWRIFFMACAELFAYRKGEEWQVGHYLFSKKRRN